MLRMRSLIASVWMACIVLGLDMWGGRGAVATEPPKPAIDGVEGERAFSDLAKFYHDAKASPPVDQAMANLESPDATMRTAAGKYILALLAQSMADESNGRGHWQRLPFWGGGSESDARQFHKGLAERLGKAAKSAEALDAALWLVEQDPDAEDQAQGITLLRRIQSPKSVDVFRKLLRPSHTCQAVLVGVLEEVAARKLTALADEVRPLCNHYRTAVRTAARKAAVALAIRDIADYRPEAAFTPSLDQQLKDIAKMVERRPAADAKWATFTVTPPPRRPSDTPQEVINPYVELCQMNIQVAELPALVPFLADENLMAILPNTIERSEWQLDAP